MFFDAPTLLATTVYVCGLLGGLLLFSWAQTRTGAALAMAGATFLLVALGLALLGFQGTLPVFVGLTLAPGILALSHGLLYSSVRVFNNRSPIFISATVGTVLWLLAGELNVVAASAGARAVLISVIIAVYSFLVAFEFWRMEHDLLPSARAAAGLAVVHGIFFLARTAFLLGWTAHPFAATLAETWSAVIAFEGLTAAVVLAFLLMSMSKERAERKFRREALIDHLTGIFNRRAFLQEAQRTLSREAQRGRSVSLLIFDIDHFKAVNDRYGHAVGDQVLQTFSLVTAAHLPIGSIFGRLGGEEFAALLANMDGAQGVFVADEIRRSFADEVVSARGADMRATTSVGVATSPRALAPLSELLAAADSALYAAKAQGRNCVRAHGLKVLVAGDPGAAPEENAPAAPRSARSRRG